MSLKKYNDDEEENKQFDSYYYDTKTHNDFAKFLDQSSSHYLTNNFKEQLGNFSQNTLKHEFPLDIKVIYFYTTST